MHGADAIKPPLITHGKPSALLGDSQSLTFAAMAAHPF